MAVVAMVVVVVVVVVVVFNILDLRHFLPFFSFSLCLRPKAALISTTKLEHCIGSTAKKMTRYVYKKVKTTPN